MKKVLHLWGVSQRNTGDFLLGPATRQWFKKNIHNADFVKKSCRHHFDEKMVDEINSKYLRGLTFHFVKEMIEVLDIAILSRKVLNPKNLKY